jgi:hypothetical protein
MALTATATQGFEYHRRVEDREILYVPGTAGTTYDEGDLVTMATSGLIAAATANQMPVARVTKRTVVAAQTVAFPVGAGYSFLPDSDVDGKMLSLVPVAPLCPIGSHLLRATFKDHKDDTVISYSASSRYIAATTGFAADDYPNGALVYVYEGPGAGEVNLVEDYDHTGGTVEKMLVLYRPFVATLTSASKFIVLSGEAASTRGIHQLGNIGVADEDELETDDHANDGKFLLYESWERLAALLKNLQVPVIGAHLFT